MTENKNPLDFDSNEGILETNRQLDRIVVDEVESDRIIRLSGDFDGPGERLAVIEILLVGEVILVTGWRIEVVAVFGVGLVAVGFAACFEIGFQSKEVGHAAKSAVVGRGIQAVLGAWVDGVKFTVRGQFARDAVFGSTAIGGRGVRVNAVGA